MTEQHPSLTYSEYLDTLTGEEEDRIEAQYGADIYTLLDQSRVPVKAVRAVVFIDLIREGLKSDTADKGKVVAAAKKRVLAMTAKEVNDYFHDGPDDSEDAAAMSVEPVTEVGKGDAEPA